MDKSVIQALDGLISGIPGIVSKSHESTGPNPFASQGQGNDATGAKPGATITRDRGLGKTAGSTKVPASAVTGKKSTYGFDKFGEDDNDADDVAQNAEPGTLSQEEQ